MTTQPVTALPSSNEDAVENVAVAIFHAAYGTSATWGAIVESTRDDYRDYARAAIAAIPDDKAELLAILRDVYKSACTNKDAFLKARALLAKHGAL